MPTESLVDKLRAGNHQAYKYIFEEYYALMCAVAFEYVRDDHISQNIAEDVMLSIWEKREQLFITVSVKAYLLSAVRNKSIDYLRANTRHYTETLSDDTILNYSGSFVPDEELFNNIVLLELEEKIQHIITQMPEETKKVFLLSRFEEKSHAEIAQELQISVNTVKYHIKRSLTILREGLKDYLLIILVFYNCLFFP